MSTLELQLKDYRLTTAKILYHMPDHPHLLQEYVWQEFDLSPRFPVLAKFLKYWENNLDGKLHSVIVDHIKVITASEIRAVSGLLHLH